jgi:hypothetical protein
MTAIITNPPRESDPHTPLYNHGRGAQHASVPPMPRACATPLLPAPPVDLLRLRADCPTRPPDWRYRLAIVLLDAGRQPGRGDRHLTAIYDLLWHLRERPADCRQLPTWLLPYRCALDVYLGPDEPDRAVLEAGLLAGRRPEVAGVPIGLSPGAAQAYARVFYDIAGRLHQVGFVAQVVCGKYREREPRLGYILRVHAWYGGPRAVDDLLHTFGFEHLALTPPYQGDDAELVDLERRAAIAVDLLPKKRATTRFMVVLQSRYERLEVFRYPRRRYEEAVRNLLKAQLRGARRLFGAAVRDNSFLAMLLAPTPAPA